VASEWLELSDSRDFNGVAKQAAPYVSIRIRKGAEMKTLKILLPVLIVLITLIFCTAQISQIDDCSDRTDAFLNAVLHGDIENACNEFIGNPAVSIYPVRTGFYSGQLRSFITIYGSLLSYEFVGESKLGDSIVRLTYVIKSQKLPLVATFYFYKPENDWKLVSITLTNTTDFWPAP
jgi:hypothetical protein